jgi:hypothetical protein
MINKQELLRFLKASQNGRHRLRWLEHADNDLTAVSKGMETYRQLTEKNGHPLEQKPKAQTLRARTK